MKRIAVIPNIAGFISLAFLVVSSLALAAWLHAFTTISPPITGEQKALGAGLVLVPLFVPACLAGVVAAIIGLLSREQHKRVASTALFLHITAFSIVIFSLFR